MWNKLLARFIGTKHDRDLKRLIPTVQAVNALEPKLEALSDEQLRALTGAFQARLADGEPLDDLLVEAFAAVREAAKRALGQRHYDVQVVGGCVLHQGKIAEMKTGEGKTLVATMPVYLNALTGQGVHVVTVNDYLARRDAAWMGPIYERLGMTVGVVQHDLEQPERRAAYAADITYGTNNEFGFDYLRDNMKYDVSEFVQRGYHYAIVDEVDSILIDEARTPLIISGPSEESVDKYYRIDRVIPSFAPERDYEIDEKSRTVTFTESGMERAEKALGVGNLYEPQNIDTLHHLQQGLRAHALFKRDVDYVVKDNPEGKEVVIVDEFTGRLMPGRRWSDGLHQAVEAKEGVKIQRENQTLATITFQNYFRMYEKLAGMTGTAETEAPEFDKIYELDVVVIPTNKPLVRADSPDVVYRTEREKFQAVVEEIADCHERGQPALVGTISIEKSEVLSSQLKKTGVPHVVLNAKYHEQEAQIVAQAGRKGAVTIATNMAGRGTDIVLGGSPEGLARQETGQPAGDAYAQALARFQEACAREKDDVLAAGGLHILGTERHESRRIDNQLRGRSGRQGDPGSSRFYLSLEDDLMRIFARDWVSNLMQKLGMEEGIPIEHNMVTKSIARAQSQVEARNFSTRKHLLEYDDVMNKQREEIYALRRDLLQGEEQREYLLTVASDILAWLVNDHCPENKEPGEWDLKGLATAIQGYFGRELPADLLEQSGRNELIERGQALVRDWYAEQAALFGEEQMRQLERWVMLRTLDLLWKDHLLGIDHLKEGIGLRGYGQRDPLVEYKRESFELFATMKERMENDIVRQLYLARPAQASDEEQQFERHRRQQELVYSAPRKDGSAEAKAAPVRRRGEKVGRNAPCPCGSGKKYKKCCGVAA